MRRVPILFAFSLLCACAAPAGPVATAAPPKPGAAPSPHAPSPDAPSSPSPATLAPPVAPNCGTGAQDWCPAPQGDACGQHGDVASCRADVACGGLRYTGESLVACQWDARGFGTNCPTVGCVTSNPSITSLPQVLSAAVGAMYVVEAVVVRRYECPPCPPGAMCKPCLGDHIVLAPEPRPEASPLEPDELVVFVDRPTDFAIGGRLRAWIVTQQGFTGRPVPDGTLVLSQSPTTTP